MIEYLYGVMMTVVSTKVLTDPERGIVDILEVSLPQFQLNIGGVMKLIKEER